MALKNFFALLDPYAYLKTSIDSEQLCCSNVSTSSWLCWDYDPEPCGSTGNQLAGAAMQQSSKRQQHLVDQPPILLPSGQLETLQTLLLGRRNLKSHDAETPLPSKPSSQCVDPKNPTQCKQDGTSVEQSPRSRLHDHDQAEFPSFATLQSRAHCFLSQCQSISTQMLLHTALLTAKKG